MICFPAALPLDRPVRRRLARAKTRGRIGARRIPKEISIAPLVAAAEAMERMLRSCSLATMSTEELRSLAAAMGMQEAKQ